MAAIKRPIVRKLDKVDKALDYKVKPATAGISLSPADAVRIRNKADRILNGGR